MSGKGQWNAKSVQANTKATLYIGMLSVGYLSVDCLSLVTSGAGSGNRTRTLSLEGSYDTISPYPRSGRA